MLLSVILFAVLRMHYCHSDQARCNHYICSIIGIRIPLLDLQTLQDCPSPAPYFSGLVIDDGSSGYIIPISLRGYQDLCICNGVTALLSKMNVQMMTIIILCSSFQNSDPADPNIPMLKYAEPLNE
jgi:hypothetical protein